VNVIRCSNSPIESYENESVRTNDDDAFKLVSRLLLLLLLLLLGTLISRAVDLSADLRDVDEDQNIQY